MINNYGMYYCHEENDTLRLVFSLEIANKKMMFNEVEVLYHNDVIVGYNIPNIMRFVKIKHHGIIFAANNIIIDIINSVLKANNLEPIGYKTDSGYHIKTIGKIKSVYAEKGTYLRDYRISEGQFCTYYDLYIDSENPNQLVDVEDEQDGIDVFISKEK